MLTNMLTNEDIQQIVEANKKIFFTKEEINGKFTEIDESIEKMFIETGKGFENIDKKFEGIDKRFENIDKKFEGIDKRFEEMFIETEKRFDRIDAEFKEIRQDISDSRDSVDAYAMQANTYFQEMVVLNHRVSRLEDWSQKIANKLGIQLEF